MILTYYFENWFGELVFFVHKKQGLLQLHLGLILAYQSLCHDPEDLQKSLELGFDVDRYIASLLNHLYC